MTEDDVFEALAKTGVKRGDTLMIHGDAVIAAQLVKYPVNTRLNVLFDVILAYLGPSGTLVIPAFTYSATKNQPFDVLKTQSEIGQFSESFRNIYPQNRTHHPIFSVIAVGARQDDFLNSSITDCFGENTVFHRLHTQNAKLMNLGCDLMLTFTHYCEQKFGVSYRYFKEFEGKIIDGGNLYKVITRYFVGKLNFAYALNLGKLKGVLLERKLLTCVSFGRFASYTVGAEDYYRTCVELLANNEFSLIEEGEK